MRVISSMLMLLCLVCLAPSQAAEKRPEGNNCNLSEPPADAGEEMNHGMVLRVFPRAKDIGSTYSGCQLLMAQDKGKWVIVSFTEVIGGDPVRIWSEYERDPARLSCRFKAGKLITGNEQVCPAPEFLLVRSLAPGCVAAIHDLVNKGLGTPWPAGCAYD